MGACGELCVYEERTPKAGSHAGGAILHRLIKGQPMKGTALAVLLLSRMTSSAAAQEPDVVTLMPKALPDISGKEVSGSGRAPRAGP